MTDIEDNAIRPLKFDDFAGQTSLKEELKVYTRSCKMRNDVLEHVLFSGSPGLGKTTLSGVIANEMGSRIVTTSGVILKDVKDIVGLLLGLHKGDVLFIDEIHRLNHSIEEVLYPAMEDFMMDVIIEENSRQRAHRVQLDKFTLIGATTKNGLISAPLRDRFGIQVRIELYSPAELVTVVTRSASILNIKIDNDGAFEIARRSHGTPRIANRLLRRVRDYAMVQGNSIINREVADKALKMLGIDRNGLNATDRAILKLIYNSGKPVGLKLIASSIGEDIETIESVYEPYLLRIGYIQVTKSGRQLTKEALKYLNP